MRPPSLMTSLQRVFKVATHMLCQTKAFSQQEFKRQHSVNKLSSEQKACIQKPIKTSMTTN
jgi:hypothetical protein